MGLANTLGFVARHPLSRGRVGQNLARLLSWQVGSRLVPGAVAVDFVNGSLLLARPGMTGATGNVYVGLHEFEDMAFVLHFLRPGDLFVDVGANIGSYTILAAAAVGADCISFEPGPEAFSWLVRNVGLNGVSNRVEARREAVGSRTGQVSFTADRDTTNHPVLGPVGEAGEERVQSVPMTTLDQALGGRVPAMLKIDVEGFETEVLDGATATLERPELLCVIMELMGGGARYGFDEEALRSRMARLGFGQYAYAPFERTLTALRGPKTSGNTIFVRDPAAVDKRLKTGKPFEVRGIRI